eukprot:COSAG06_NODE_35_length_30757_cov_53.112532_2_plen_81_part_00
MQTRHDIRSVVNAAGAVSKRDARELIASLAHLSWHSLPGSPGRTTVECWQPAIAVASPVPGTGELAQLAPGSFTAQPAQP